MNKQYISICGMVSEQHIKGAHERLAPPVRQRVIYAAQTSPKTLLGHYNRRGREWYPSGPDALHRLGAACGRLGAVYGVHCNPEDTTAEHVSALSTLVSSALTSPNDSAERVLQLNNLDWVRNDWSWLVRRLQHIGFRVILQANSASFDVGAQSLARAARCHAADYVLLDTSGGHGEAFDSEQYSRYIDQLQQHGISVAVAGGLGPDCLDTLAWLAERFDGLSCDAETRLRDSYVSAQPSTSRFSPRRAACYATQAAKILKID